MTRYPALVSTVVVLNGTSSSGKTTIARAVQEAAPTLFLNFSIDSVLSALPRSALARITAGAEISDLKLPELVRAYYGCVSTLLELGHDLVIDHAVTARYHAELLIAAIGPRDALLVGVDCPVDVLAERERARGDRRVGMAAQQQKSIHTWLEYDILIDTSSTPPDEAAHQILGALSSGRRAIEKTRAKLTSG